MIANYSCTYHKKCSKEEALKLAKNQWAEKFGKESLEMKPINIKLKSDSIWVIEGSLPAGFDGGVPYAEINANTCEILEISHGK